jgi:hypothetical protein
MLRTNLSTRPFYNERAVHVLAAVLAIVVLAVTAWQVVRVVRLSRYKTELNTSIKRDRAESELNVSQAQQVRSGMDQKELATLATGAKEANNLIAQRTFSWTALFNQLEATLPGDVMLMGVHPEIEEGATQLHMDVQGKGEEVIESFWERLEKTGSFHNVEWSNVNVTDDGLHRMTMNVVYTPGAPATRPPSAPPAEKTVPKTEDKP